MTQLFRDSDPATSREAAANLDVTKLEAIIMETLHVHRRDDRWFTSLEIVEMTGLHPWSVSPRICDLVAKGLVDCVTMKGYNSAGKLRLMQHYRAIQKS